ncbi:uncharacterized protein TRIADDRAFT_51013 [Trichoplax adhaerens]|uniref:Sugar phosphate phosphatase n=1 Tax=Trichoplax adhaerens TaxID=10228 RepID=B3SAB3_TRIAD|nr:hypothetical protein TRIADDRAFT_51013 [Trichoplax adhaerens]EDV20231.1 hypothetical protein TRIADDRAFT_51013 [Trichoplax adhaerens]|eukprot:XP_002117181.1 hypothetical protein TRIADDRAFT_51013 [Trichoplax adhaerens]
MESLKMNSIPERLSARYKGTFAYFTIRDRLPVTLTRVIDGLSRKISKLKAEHNEDVAEDAIGIISKLSKLRNEMQTNKEIPELNDEFEDLPIWNNYLRNADQLQESERPLKWFTASWLFTECYMYRGIFSAIMARQFLKSYDPYEEQKQQSFRPEDNIYPSVIQLAMNAGRSAEKFSQLLQFSLWGNMFDLSLFGNVDVSTKLTTQLETIKSNILSNDDRQIYSSLEYRWHNVPTNQRRIDFVLDNIGPEFLFDLCLAEYLYRNNMANQIYFHVKSIPWFVSDVMLKDFFWQVETMKVAHNCPVISELGRKVHQYIQDGVWQIVEDSFWTTCHDYNDMRTIAPDLYNSLEKSSLVILKGDLNYRKLIGDRNWPHTYPFKQALRSFRPAPLAALRTIKADLVVGLADGVSDELSKQDSNWMTCGKYGLIQFCDSKLLANSEMDASR